jgi:16S rRNA (cytosine967-C5)-methyltransferase
MTPGARVAAAIEILHDMSEGLAAEQALTRWARRSRFAGSKDRAAIRDHIFDVLRCQRTAAHYGGGTSPRSLMIGMLHQQGVDLETLFTGDGHAPVPLAPTEGDFPLAPTERGVVWNLPDWLLPEFEESLGEGAEAAALASQSRAPVHLRVNTAQTDRAAAAAELASEGIETQNNPLCDTALTVLEGARKIRNSNAFLEGRVELQDAASQAITALLPKAGRVLDYCAGGGGKALALAADAQTDVFAHDIDPRRMADLPARAGRAGARITQVATSDLTAAGPFDTVLCDAPCSGSGAWRRAAEGKWTLTPARLSELTTIQDDILDAAADLVTPKGVLAFATCSVLRSENEDRVAAFLARHAGWKCTLQHRFEISDAGDGFFTAHLMRN